MTAEKIQVHEKALAHLSRGLYRSPASALRELISNAWDANATRVEIDTNFPEFQQIVIEDNGDGFTRAQFAKLMRRGIGNSEKREKGLSPRFGRTTIGRYGIGMLGIAQICGSFTITSRTRSGEAFKARIILYDFAKKRMDEADSDLVHRSEKDTAVDVGTFEFEKFDAESLDHGTIIVADDVHPTFIRAFKESVNQNYVPVPREWRAAVGKVLSSTASLQILGDYWRLLWELSAACPLPYLDDTALPSGACRTHNDRLNAYRFRLFVDGRELFKPVYLHGNKGGYTSVKIPRETYTVYGQPLTFSGYLVVQEGKQLLPDELRGVMVRIKDVGVGYYDISMLDYRNNEGPRSRWLTAEIFVEEGLEDALNIDRDSFNRFHPQFRRLQQEVHKALQSELWPTVYRKIDERSQERKDQVAKKRDKATRAVVREAAADGPDIKVRRLDVETKDEPSFTSVTKDGDEVEIAVASADDLPVPKPSRQLASAVLTIFELALLESGREAQRRKFSQLLIELLRNW